MSDTNQNEYKRYKKTGSSSAQRGQNIACFNDSLEIELGSDFTITAPFDTRGYFFTSIGDPTTAVIKLQYENKDGDPVDIELPTGYSQIIAKSLIKVYSTANGTTATKVYLHY